jgi:hypothetical protein
LTNSVGGAPEPSSLFNLNTLQTLIDLGFSVPDITLDPTVTLTLNSSWTDLTNNLGFTKNEQTYLLWLWLVYAGEFTVNRQQDGGNS